MNIPNRRQFIKRAATGFAGTTFLAACTTTEKSRWRFFSEKEAGVLDLVCEQIIPSDDFPGAIEAGCLNFIDKQLDGEYKRFQNDYRNGLASLQQTCQRQFGLPFQELDWDQRTSLLEAIDTGQVNSDDWHSVSPQHFFNLVRDFTMQGFYGSPRHGGNNNYLSYKMLDLDIPYIIGQNRYTQGLDKPNGWIEK